ncbi:MAG: hypothetical protein P4M15_13745 [Alphaproteobacteria bacterium]|nr:hypothetical protein [Alphaproteobacteria bacterium]
MKKLLIVSAALLTISTASAFAGPKMPTTNNSTVNQTAKWGSTNFALVLQGKHSNNNSTINQTAIGFSGNTAVVIQD